MTLAFGTDLFKYIGSGNYNKFRQEVDRFPTETLRRKQLKTQLKQLPIKS